MNALEEMKQEMKKLREERDRIAAEKTLVDEENTRKNVNGSFTVAFQLQRQKDFVVFPLMQLPEVIMLGVVEKLKPRHRRHLMQSCSKYRTLLHRKKAEHLDCRLPADFDSKFTEHHNTLYFTLTVKKRNSPKTYFTREWWIRAASPTTPPEVVPQIKDLVENFADDKFLIRLHDITANPQFIAVIKDVVGRVSEFYTVQMASDNQHVHQWATLLLDCPRTTSLSLVMLRKLQLYYEPRAQPYRDVLEARMKKTASQKGIEVIIDQSASDKVFELRLEVSDDNVKTLTIYG